MADKLLAYTELLHRFEDPDVQEVRAFRGRYADDAVFRSRVEKLNALNLLQTAMQSDETAATAATESTDRTVALAAASAPM